ncbi:MAG: serine hydroxymethyltransferase, partial [Campylobacteraceae bacterium]|nr:serine hydroxymethyltransferase [Campylobacteraceae bacterium]
ITVNKNTVPGETRSPFVTSGVRLGSPALTARGMKEEEFKTIAGFIADVLDNIENQKVQQEIKEKVKSLASNFKIYDQATY